MLTFGVQFGTEPYVWSFGGLTEGLQGDREKGVVRGVINKEGYYNVNLQVADKVGKSISAFITLNIQPNI